MPATQRLPMPTACQTLVAVTTRPTCSFQERRALKYGLETSWVLLGGLKHSKSGEIFAGEPMVDPAVASVLGDELTNGSDRFLVARPDERQGHLPKESS